MKILTKSGWSTFHGVVSTGKQETLIFDLGQTSIEVSLGHTFICDGINVIAKDLKVGDSLETKNGLKQIISIKQGFQEVFDVLETEDHTFYQNDVLNHNCQFLGSSSTLIQAETLQKLKAKEPEYVRDNMLKIYEDPIKGEKYILTIDAQKNGGDYFTVQIFKITNYPFEQVQAQKLHINYLQMPVFVLEWAESYNFQYVIIENNEGQGQSVQDVLLVEHEYENLHFDHKPGTKIRRKQSYPGFRTTRGNRQIILSTLQTFLDEGKLVIHDQDLIEELSHFILINNKYQADDGYHDDMVMGQAFLFVPFIDIKNFDGFQDVVQALYDKDSDQDFDFMDNIVFGSFDDGQEKDQDMFKNEHSHDSLHDFDVSDFV